MKIRVKLEITYENEKWANHMKVWPFIYELNKKDGDLFGLGVSSETRVIIESLEITEE